MSCIYVKLSRRVDCVLIWFFRNVFQVGEGAFPDRTRYLSTVDFATLMPSFPNSPTMRGVPHNGLVPET
jgi:hypothetical protein